MKLRSIILSVLFLFAGEALSKPLTESPGFGIFRDKPVSYFHVTAKEPYKGNYEEALKYLLLLYNKNYLKNNFCLLGLDWADKERNAIVFWEEGGILFTWDLEGGDEDYYYLSLALGDSISLKEDVFPLSEILKKPYDYIQAYSQESIDILKNECNSHGENIVIHAFSQPKKCDDGSEVEYAYDIKNEHLCDAVQLRNYDK
ncbi:TPA: hypothetical protein ACWX3U_004595 [Escherichia coli]